MTSKSIRVTSSKPVLASASAIIPPTLPAPITPARNLTKFAWHSSPHAETVRICCSLDLGAGASFSMNVTLRLSSTTRTDAHQATGYVRGAVRCQNRALHAPSPARVRPTESKAIRNRRQERENKCKSRNTEPKASRVVEASSLLLDLNRYIRVTLSSSVNHSVRRESWLLTGNSQDVRRVSVGADITWPPENRTADHYDERNSGHGE